VELARAARTKDEFLAGMSHELRTPLSAILGLTEVLQEQTAGPLNEYQLKSLQVIEESGRHLLALINDILDLSKIEASELDLQLSTVPLETICQVSLQFVKQAALKKKIQLSSSLHNASTMIQVDTRRFKQILVNLLSNAVKFTPEGGQVGLEVVEEPEQKRFQFTVWDTGIGIAPEYLPQLFKPFVQIDSSLSREYEGTGLGLALVYRLTELHGGSISVSSEPGQGSRFTIFLPQTQASEAVEEPEPVEAPPKVSSLPQVPAGAASAGPKENPPLILLAEDNEDNIRIFGDYLEATGYHLVIARNGLEAIKQAREVSPALILMDIQLPKMDGLQVIRHLRGEPQLAGIPIIALTALAMSGDRERCLAAGANDYLSKPVGLKDLTNAIKAQLKPPAPMA
jgi:CheY-like chemotaxis protein/anti-sigma regulatory factor (Ser/Thr protein kinase)